MPDRDYSKYQRKVIQRYYDNRDAIDTQRLSEQVTTLYLSSGKKAEKTWESVGKTLERMGVKSSRITHILTTKDPAILAELVKDLEAGKVELKPPEKKPGENNPGEKKPGEGKSTEG